MTDTATSKTTTRAPRARNRSGRLLRLALAFITAVAVVDAIVGEKGLLATIRARQEYTELAARLAGLRAENARLRETARRLREDPETIEDLARRELGLIRPGEVLFIIKDVSPDDLHAAPDPEPSR